MRITFLGGAGGVTGANHLLQIRNTKMIVDCGLFQSGDFVDELNRQNFGYDPQELNYALITHAHLDHVGRLPKLYHAGFRGKILATGPTMEIAALILQDAFHIMEEEGERFKKPLLYQESDIRAVMGLFEPIDYEEVVSLGKDIKAVFYDAGHILGSAMVHITDVKEKKSIVFSGDFGNESAPILRNPTQVAAADYIVVESCYGDRNHETQKSRQLMLAKIFLDTLKKKGILLIPAFSMERTQELIYIFNHLVEKHKFTPIPIFVDSPLAIKITEVFKRYPQYFDEEALALYKAGDDFFDFPGLVLTPTPQKSKMIRSVRSPKIIIAGSGMMHGGRITHHLTNYLGDRRTTVLIVGFQVRGSLGRRLLEGAKHVRIMGKEIPVRASVTALGALSAHGDSNHLFAWVKNIKGAKRAFVVQGDPQASEFLANRINKGTTVKAMVPGLGYSEEL